MRRIARSASWILFASLPVVAAVFAVRAASRIESLTWAPSTATQLGLWSGHGCIGAALAHESRRPEYVRGFHFISAPVTAQTTAHYFRYLDNQCHRRRLLGFWYARESIADTANTLNQTTDIVAAPAWVVASASAVPLLVMLTGHARRRRRVKQGQCPECGYDLRAHKQGERCPECGTGE